MRTRYEARNITSTTTPAANTLDETSKFIVITLRPLDRLCCILFVAPLATETAYQTETSTFVYPTTNTTQPLSDNPISETTEELQTFGNGAQQQQLNISRSGNNTSLPYQQNVPITHRPGNPKGNALRESPPLAPSKFNVTTSTPAPENAKGNILSVIVRNRLI